jgi:hypothetical protein
MMRTRKSRKNEKKIMIPSFTTEDRTALSVGNPRVKSIAYRFHWSVDTVVKRVENALTSPIEQTLYLQVALGYRIHPESLLKMLKVFRGDEGLSEADLEQVSVGPNLVKSKFDDVLGKVEIALMLIDKTSDASEYMMSMDHAAQLVEAYGDYAEDILGEIIENPFQAAEQLEITSQTPRVIVGVAVKALLQSINDHRNGQPLPLRLEDMFSHVDKKRKIYE